MRTVALLDEQGLAVGSIVVNQIQPEGDGCTHCRRRHQIHQAEIEALRKRAGSIPLRFLPSESRELRGLEELRLLADKLWTPDAAQQ